MPSIEEVGEGVVCTLLVGFVMLLLGCGSGADSALDVGLDGCTFEVDPNYTRVGDGEYVAQPCYAYEDSTPGTVDYSACCPPPTVVVGLVSALVVCGY